MGSLKRHWRRWKKLDGWCPMVDRWLRRGVPLLFHHYPKRWSGFQSPMSPDKEEFVSTELARLLHEGAIKQVNYVPWVRSPLGVALKKSGKFRLTVDMRYLNEHLNRPKFSYEGLETAAQLVKQGDHMVSLDLKEGYHHVSMAKGSQTSTLR